MKHLGDITKIHNVPFVNCITFGSPCQDLSIAGKRAGLAGERSGLFMEAVRIIKEMRDKSGGLYPTFAVWENVPGAFSTNKGNDFHAVWRNWPKSSTMKFQSLDLRQIRKDVSNGQRLGLSAETDGALRGELSTLNTGECPSVAVESRLSWILEVNAPEKYYLSERACQGILNRASRRGKELPEILRTALLDMIEWWKERDSMGTKA